MIKSAFVYLRYSIFAIFQPSGSSYLFYIKIRHPEAFPLECLRFQFPCLFHVCCNHWMATAWTNSTYTLTKLLLPMRLRRRMRLCHYGQNCITWLAVWTKTGRLPLASRIQLYSTSFDVTVLINPYFSFYFINVILNELEMLVKMNSWYMFFVSWSFALT